ncbi:MAG: hypothetical protein AB1444_15590, partial [Spirochaetota bacterium]
YDIYKLYLGDRQIDSLKYYLKDLKNLDKNYRLSNYGLELEKFISNYHSKKFLLWSILWVNLSYNSTLFNFLNYVNKGIYSKDNKINILFDNYGKKNRYIINAYHSLVGTFERTPIGYELKQGIIKKQGRERIVIKEGDLDVLAEAILYNLYMFADKHNMYNFIIDEIEHLDGSPQKVFTITSPKGEYILKTIWHTNFFDVLLENNYHVIKLYQELTSIDIVKRIGGSHEIQ